MSLQELEIETGKYKCVNRFPGNGDIVSPVDVKDLKDRGMGGTAYSRLRSRRCKICPTKCELGGLMARVAEESRSLFSDTNEE